VQPLPAGLEPGLAQVIEDIRQQLIELQNPQLPHPVCALSTANLPPAASYQNCIVYATDLSTFAVSNATHWIRVDTGGVIV
jgi:hypothetical protein